MLQEPNTSQYDLHFNLLGFPIRVAWGFWLVAAILGWGWSGWLDARAANEGMESPGAAVLLLIWIAAVFVSILLHELGHSLAMRWYGIDSRIVLYHFGGLAVPDSFTSWRGARVRNVGPREQIVIAAAGPAMQLSLGIAVWLIALAMNIKLEETQELNALLGTNFAANAELPSSAALYGMFSALIWTSVMWSILNLAPILPLDGGHITLHLLRIYGRGDAVRTAHFISVIAAAGLGLWFLSSGRPGGIMFLIFAASNWQAMQMGSRGF